MIYFYLTLTLYFGIILINGFFSFKTEMGLDIVWSDNPLLIPMDKVKHRKYFIGYTNRYEDFTYRLKPKFKIKVNLR